MTDSLQGAKRRGGYLKVTSYETETDNCVIIFSLFTLFILLLLLLFSLTESLPMRYHIRPETSDLSVKSTKLCNNLQYCTLNDIVLILPLLAQLFIVKTCIQV